MAKRKRKPKPFMSFNFGGVLLIWLLSLLGCFALYMVSVNRNTEPEIPVTSLESSSEGEIMDNPVAESEEKDSSYLNQCVFLGDSTLETFKTGLAVSASKERCFVQGNLPASEANSQISSLAPKYIYCLFGHDLIADALAQQEASAEEESTVTSWSAPLQADLISEYQKALKALMTAYPDAQIILLSTIPADATSDSVSNEIINSWNSALLSTANEMALPLVDSNTALKGTNGGFNTDALKDLNHYILSHTVS